MNTRTLATAPAVSGRSVLPQLLALLALFALMAVIAAAVTQTDAGMFANPQPAGTYVYGGVPRAVPAWMGIERFVAYFQVPGLVFSLLFFGYYGWRSWREARLHSGLLALVSMSVMAFFWEPPINWSMYLSFNPGMWHMPPNTPWMRIAPNFEPWSCFYGYPVWFLAPALMAYGVYNRLSRDAAPGAWLNRHPLLALGLLGWAFGMVFDFLLELMVLRGGLYVYSQVWPAVSINVGDYYQFPALLAVPTIALSMACCAMLLHRDAADTSLAERIAARTPGLRRFPVLGALVVGSALACVSYVVYTGAFAAVRVSGLATSVASPWPYEDQLIYDPDGLYEKAGAAGPFMDDRGPK
jgi:hypothetical protein